MNSNTESLLKEIENLKPWYHNIQLTDAVWTIKPNAPGIKGENCKKVIECIPEDLSGKTVLDIGCNSGFFSFLCESRGAKKVIGIDRNSHYIKQANFCSKIKNSNVDFRIMNVYDINNIGINFDVVLFLGTLYHLTDLETVMKIISNINKKTLILETATSKKYESLQDPILEIPAGKTAGLRAPNLAAMRYLIKEIGKYKIMINIFTGGRSCFIAEK